MSARLLKPSCMEGVSWSGRMLDGAKSKVVLFFAWITGRLAFGLLKEKEAILIWVPGVCVERDLRKHIRGPMPAGVQRETTM